MFVLKVKGRKMDYKKEITDINKEQFEKCFCEAYIKTIHPSEGAYYRKHLITWRKMMGLIIKKQYLLLEKSSACIALYNVFWSNLIELKNIQKIPIEYLLLPTEINNCLRRNRVIYIEDLRMSYDSMDELIKIRKIGKKAAEEIIIKLEQFDLENKEKMDIQVIRDNRECYLLLWEKRLELLDIIRAPELDEI